MKSNQHNDKLKQEIDVIIAYEKYQNTPYLSASRILKYVGVDPICTIYGGTVKSEKIALAILEELLKKDE